jgi:predicted RNase H-like nuclease (RuvC/YqgF family)
MSADEKAAAAWDDYVSQQQEEKIEELERQLNAANDRIKRLEEAGDALKAAGYFGGFGDAVNKWIKVREDKL